MFTLTLTFHVTTTQDSSYIIMKLLVILAISSLAYAKHLNPAIRFADSKIIGGSEAPKRNYSINNYTNYQNYNKIFISNFR